MNSLSLLGFRISSHYLGCASPVVHPASWSLHSFDEEKTDKEFVQFYREELKKDGDQTTAAETDEELRNVCT